MPKCVIGIDSGGTMTKVAAFDLNGNELACARQSNAILFPAPGRTERDPEAMWEAAARAIRDVLAQTGTDPDDVLAVATSGYGSGLFVVDADHRPVRPAIQSTDGRGQTTLDALDPTKDIDPSVAQIGQRMWPAQALVLLAWLRDNEPDTVARTHSILFCKDFLRLRLCGELSTDPTDAGIAGLIDVTETRYAEDVLARLGLQAWTSKLPPIRPSAEVAGHVTEEAARKTGLRPGTPVARGLLDVTASAVAAGVTAPEQLSVVAGTFSINSSLHARPRASTPPFLQSRYPIGDMYLATEGGATSASNFDWLCNRVLTGDKHAAEACDRSIYEICNERVETALARDNDILFFPFLFGGPKGAPAGYLGLTASSDQADVLRATFEGIAYAHRYDIERLLSGSDAAMPQVVRLAGGASNSAVWSQMFTDVLDMPVELSAGSELGAKGTAIAAAVAVGAHSNMSSAVESMVATVARYTPSDARKPVYDGKYRRYAALIDKLADAWGAATAPA